MIDTEIEKWNGLKAEVEGMNEKLNAEKVPYLKLE